MGEDRFGFNCRPLNMGASARGGSIPPSSRTCLNQQTVILPPKRRFHSGNTCKLSTARRCTLREDLYLSRQLPPGDLSSSEQISQLTTILQMQKLVRLFAYTNGEFPFFSYPWSRFPGERDGIDICIWG